MSKQQIIEAIRQHNRSAEVDFLISFDEQVLQTYLQRLRTLVGGRGSVWVRRGETSAVVTRMTAA